RIHGAAAANQQSVAETEITAPPTRQPQAGQGMYYHTAMLSWWFNQLSEMVPPARIYQELGRFIRAGATEYFLLNLSDVRPVPLGTDCAMKLAWDATPYRDHTDAENQAAFLVDWCRRQYGAPVALPVAALYEKYFDVPSHRPEVRQGEHAPHSYLKKLGVEVFPLLLAGQPLTAQLNDEVATRLTSALANLATLGPLLAEAEALAPRLPPDRREFFQSHLLTVLGLHLHGHEMLAAYCAALLCLQRQDRPGTEAQLVRALAGIDALFAMLRLAERGKWAAWYIGEHFVGIDLSRDQIRTQLALVRGETPPPSRSRRFYPELYQHQDAFRQNFPLMYPSQPAPAATKHGP
ncbi:MAG: glycosyl hydrolase 115 family protein, partial [Opitutaceae bacterium]